MKKRYYFLIFITLFVASAFTDVNNEKKTISNKLYSFSVPENWEANYPPGLSGDGLTPSERDANGYHLYYLSWKTIEKKEDFSNGILLVIASFKRLDNQPLSIENIEEIENHKMGNEFLEKKEISAKPHQKKFIIKSMNTIMDVKKGTWKEKQTQVFLFHNTGNILHCVNISVNEDRYQLPETQKTINEILDSFSVKSGKK
jgi:hypothetical protein